MIGTDLDGIVISGIAGAFPNSENVQEFKENLLAGNDMISTSTRSEKIGMRLGLLKTIDRFDYSFFRMTHGQANTMTVASRLLQEKTYEAILDAGYNPKEIKGKNIAVIGALWEGTDEGDPAWDKKPNNYIEGFGRLVFMVTNRISNLLDVHGPSYPVNTACSSSLYAIDHAVKVIQSGQCEGAIVCSANFCFSFPLIDASNKILSSKGTSAPFDIDASGYVRAETVGVLFLQRKQFARRIYANIIHSTTNSDGFKEEGSAFPSVIQQVQLYQQFYKEIDLDPTSVSYIEAHGTGTRVGDVVEGTSIEEFFCTNRTTPLKMGSVKSNMGHAEAAAALCSVIKMIIAFETGIIPANLRYNTPNPKIKGLFNGHLEVISKPTPLEGKYFALNSFGIGGSNGHIVISPHAKVKSADNAFDKKLPRLVTASGRTEEAVECILNNVEQNQNDTEYIGLYHEIFKYGINGHLHRGYAILQKNKPAKISKKRYSGEKRPIWFVFSGMGSQWPTMGKSLMNIPIFAQSIQRSHRLLQSKGLDLVKIITEDDPQIFENILNSFVGISAIQIALVDLLRKLNIEPDGMIGHSLGESGCAYADGCFTAEQMILGAYYRGLVSLETNLVHGTMAAVGQNFEFVKNIIPPEIDIACHNGPTSCTISGPTKIMRDFIPQLNEKKIFVRAVNSSNIAYHSRYITSAGPKLLSHLKMVIPEPKLRSKKWISTSAPEHKWNCDEVKYCSAEYHTNNLLSPVLLEESYQYIPHNAITVEIAPHGLLNAILKRSLPTTVDNIPLTMRNHENNVEYLLNALGRLYEIGCDMEISHLYPPIEFPVGKSTPMISPLIKWQHDEQWQIDEIHSDGISQSREKKFAFNVKNPENEYFRGHVIDGRNLYPAFGYLWLVVETVAMIEDKQATELSVVFENVHFETALVIRDGDLIIFYVSVQLNGSFEVRGNGAIVATGKVKNVENAQKNTNLLNNAIPITDTLPMNKDDFYKELRLRGYQYKGSFKNVESVTCDGKYGEVSWSDNFICFMDAMAQITLLQMDCRDLIIPTFMQKVAIDCKEHLKILESLDKENRKFPVNFYPNHGVLRSGGIQINGWKGAEIARQKNLEDPVHETYQFAPYIKEEKMDLFSTVRICVQITLKNSSHISKASTYELLDREYDPELPSISSAIAVALNYETAIESNVNVLINSENVKETNEQNGINILNEKLPTDKNASLIVVSNIQRKTDIFESIFGALRDEGFIMTTASINENVDFEKLGFDVCFSRITNDAEKIILLKKKTNLTIIGAIQIKNDTYSWISEIQNALLKMGSGTDEKLVIFADKEPTSGILGFFNCLRTERPGTNVSCFFVMDENAPAFSLDNPFYKSQFEKNLSFNIYKHGEWGSYWHLVLNTGVEMEPSNAFCMLKERGNLSSFEWVQGPLDPSKYENSDEGSLVHVYYNSLNFKDVMLAVGRISAMDTNSYSRLIESQECGEFSGRNEEGKRLMGMAAGRGISTMIESIPELTWTVPDSMTLEEAATIPVVYATVIYAFFLKAQLKEGHSVLIHSGGGGIGQAAIYICLHYKCNIFTTVGTPEKVEFMRKTFPQIPQSHIGNSRDTSFLKMVMEETNGKGVDLVLNSLAEDKLRASILCVARGGHFLEIGKFDMAKNNSLELGHFLNDISFHSVQLNILFLKRKDEKLMEIGKRLQEMVDQGIIKPINMTVFRINEVESAFRYMASGKHIGKLLIKIRDEEPDLKTKPNLMRLKAARRFYCNKNKSYVILGGLGGFGMELVDWLIIRGARNIVITSRTGVKNGYQSYRIQLWHSYGVKLVISTADISQKVGVEKILEMANSLGPVAGIFNLAMVLRDGDFSNQTEDHFRTAANPKAIATSHLDQLSRKMCPHLEQFVMFSSVTCGHGNADQTNYGFANSVMERICELRRADNLPGMAIQWGAIGEVGYFSDLVENNTSVTLKGWAQQRIKSCLETMNRFMTISNPVVGSRIVAEKRKTDIDIKTTVANVLGIKDIRTISLTWTFAELGMDSILGLELRQILEAEFNIFLTPEDLRTMTFAKLQRLKEEKDNTLNQDNEVSTQLQFMIDAKLRNQPILRIPLIKGRIQEPLSINENPTIFAFPGIEGLALSMEPLAKNLPIQVLCFQYHFIEEQVSVQKLRDYFSSYILEKLRPEEEFNIIGHSFGAAMAIEVAEILEKRGRKGRIWLIDGSPRSVRLTSIKSMQEIAIEKHDEYVQNKVCEGIITILLPELPKESYSKQIQNMTGWDSKKKISISILSKMTKSKNVEHQLFDILFNLYKAASHYEKLTSFPLQSSCVLIRCVQDYLPIDDSYGLTPHFENPVKVCKVDDVDHFSILLHSKTANMIINSSPWKKD